MNYRFIGNSGMKISEIGLGCWQIGGNWGKTISEDRSIEILQSAVDSGVSFFDTADVYGGGRSEKLIGIFLKETDSSVTVATKFGRGGNMYPDNYSEGALRLAVESSLRNLGVDSLDLLQLHCIPEEVMKEGSVFEWLRNLKREGMIKQFGASVETIDEALLCLEQEGIASLQVIFNLVRQRLVTDLLPKAEEKAVGIIARVPLASGLLTGKFTKETVFPKDDHRNFNKDGQAFNVGETFAGLPFEKGLELTDTLKGLIPEGMTMAQMALRWILDHQAVTTVIPGASSSLQIRQNAAISDLPPLSEELHERLSSLYTTEIHQYIRGAY